MRFSFNCPCLLGEALLTTQGVYVVQTLFLILLFSGTCDICRNDIDRQSNNIFKNVKISQCIFLTFFETGSHVVEAGLELNK